MNWKDIPGYEGLYQISDCGKVKSCSRSNTFKEKILKPSLVRGYYKVILCKNGKLKPFYVHRLVALVFLEQDNKLTVNHIDECKTNNHISNLEYLTRGDNIRAWIKNNPQRNAEIYKKGQQNSLLSRSQQVLDTQTGKTFSSIKAVGSYMYEKEGAKSPWFWANKIYRNTQNRFKIIKL